MSLSQSAAGRGEKLPSEDSPVGVDPDRGSPSGTKRGCDSPTCRPCPTLQDPGEGQLGGCLAQGAPDELGDLIEQGHGEGAPLDDDLVAGRVDDAADAVVAGHERAEIEEEAAVAVLGQAGEGAGLRSGCRRARGARTASRRATETACGTGRGQPRARSRRRRGGARRRRGSCRRARSGRARSARGPRAARGAAPAPGCPRRRRPRWRARRGASPRARRGARRGRSRATRRRRGRARG